MPAYLQHLLSRGTRADQVAGPGGPPYSLVRNSGSGQIARMGK
jgi:hypothetical protein